MRNVREDCSYSISSSARCCRCRDIETKRPGDGETRSATVARACTGRCGAGTKSAAAGAQIVRMPGLQARPLGGGTSIGTEVLLATKPLWPAGRRVLPRLLPPVDRQVEQPIAVIHRLDAANCGPVSLEDIRSLSQVANDVHHAHPASNQEGFERVLGRVPGHLPAHEVAVPRALRTGLGKTRRR
jgi:hypothetical protein